MSDVANAAVEIGEEAPLEQKLGELTIDVKSPNSEKTMRKKRLPTAERIRLWEKEQEAKNVLSTGLKGKVKWYSVLRRYGFISRDDGEKDVFVHQTAISKSATEKFYLRTLADEEEVVFDLVDGKSGPEAANVSGPDGENVIGSRYRHKLLSRFRKNRKPGQSVDSEKQKPVEKSEGKAEPSPKSEGSKKPKKQRKNRKPKVRQEKGAGDAPANQSVSNASEASQPASTSSSPDAKVSKIIDEEPGLSKIDRCDSALGDARLGAEAINAQI